jgi:uncharacterized Zn finger protein (UPF0148 family)
MNNATWACFDCRETIRRPCYVLKTLTCPSCGEILRCIGDKIRVPPKDQIKHWDELRETVPKGINEWLRRMRSQELELRIAKLELMKENDGRKKKLRYLRKQLAEIQ